jgi:predicted AlkP superfamily pyrophosphatase or phosphodiesterase
MLDGWCHELIETFGARHPDGHQVVICSDHGMADVERAVDAGLRSRFGAPRPGRYVYFLDANMLRVWSDDARLRDDVGAFLRERGDGVLLTPAQRVRHGIASPAFGDHVFVLDEGAIFWPGWYGGYFPRGMHGYMPDIASQQAIFIHAGTGAAADRPLPARSRDIHAFLQDMFGLERAVPHG